MPEVVKGKDPLMGRRIDEYRIDKLLGKGGMGAVYRARMPGGDTVAIKVLLQDLSEDVNLVRRFRREADAGARLQHPSIIRTLGTGSTDDGVHYIIMEFFPGRSLEELLQRRGRFTERQTLAIAYRVATALEHAHRIGIFHRDIKPSNIMLDRTGAVRVADFGIAQVLSGQKLTVTGTFLGTPAYCPPEQLRGEQVDGRADIYALGVTMYELLTGRLPYEGRTPFEVMESVLRDTVTPITERRDDVTFATVTLIEDMMERDREKRTTLAAQTVEAFDARLRDVLEVQGSAEGFEDALRHQARGAYGGKSRARSGDKEVGDRSHDQRNNAKNNDKDDKLIQADVATVAENPMAQSSSMPSLPRARAARGKGLPLPSGPWLVRLGVVAAVFIAYQLGLHARIVTPVLVRVMAQNDRAYITRAQDGIRFLGAAAVPSLLSAIDSADGKLRQRLFDVLGDLEAPGATDTLMAGLQDADPLVRAHALDGIVALNHPDTVELSLAALRDGDSRVRVAAVVGIGATRDPQHLSALARAYSGADADLRDALTQAITPFGDMAIPHLSGVWYGLGQNGKREVVICAEAIGGAEATRMLIGKLDEPQVAVRFFIVEALQRMTAEAIGDDPARWRAWADQKL